MTPDDDHWAAMTHLPHQLRSSRDRDLDALGEGGKALGEDLQEVAAFLTQLRRIVDRPAPPPSAQLASVLAHGFVPQVPAPSSRTVSRPAPSVWLRRSALAFGLSAGLSASLVGAAAASDRLPDGAKEVWERVIDSLTPFSGQDQRPARPALDNHEVPDPASVREQDVDQGPTAAPTEDAGPSVADGETDQSVAGSDERVEGSDRTDQDESEREGSRTDDRLDDDGDEGPRDDGDDGHDGSEQDTDGGTEPAAPADSETQSSESGPDSTDGIETDD